MVMGVARHTGSKIVILVDKRTSELDGVYIRSVFFSPDVKYLPPGRGI